MTQVRGFIIGSLIATLSLILIAGCNRSGTPKLETEDQQVVYSIGYDMGTKLQSLRLKDGEMAILEAGLRDGIENKDAAIETKNMFPKISAFVRARGEEMKEIELREANAFLAKVEKDGGVQKLESGVLYKEMEAGTGPSPKEEDRVQVHYHGTLRDGTVFDSSKERGQPTSFPLNRVIPCWTEGVQKMKVGGKAMLYCPSSTAYGDRGAPPKIKPGAALAFEIELLDILDEEGNSKTGAAAPVKDAKPAAKKAAKKNG